MSDDTPKIPDAALAVGSTSTHVVLFVPEGFRHLLFTPEQAFNLGEHLMLMASALIARRKAEQAEAPGTL